jgi:hypothetical protein
MLVDVRLKADCGAVEKGFGRANSGAHVHSVIPAQAGIQGFGARVWIPAFAGMTRIIFNIQRMRT